MQGLSRAKDCKIFVLNFVKMKMASMSAALAVLSPATQALCFVYGQEMAGAMVPTLLGAVDRSVDLSQERFHSEYYDPLELRMQCE